MGERANMSLVYYSLYAIKIDLLIDFFFYSSMNRLSLWLELAGVIDFRVRLLMLNEHEPKHRNVHTDTICVYVVFGR